MPERRKPAKKARKASGDRKKQIPRSARDDRGERCDDSGERCDDSGERCDDSGERCDDSGERCEERETRFAGLLGAHTSIAGGTHEAPPRAKAIGATAMQMFTKMANRWAERECADDECTAFRAALADTDVRATAAHDSYLINLASPDPTLRRRSIESFVAELARCEALGLDFLVSHPGNYMDDRASGIARNGEAIGEALERVPGRVTICLESTSGSGTAIGATFEDLAALIETVPAAHRARVAVCADTCHLYSAGYDLVHDYDGVWRHFDDVLGLARLRVMHLNDSKTPFDSKRDRHELIGEGSLGEAPFRRIMCDERLVAIPKVIETPKLDDATKTDSRMLARLRGYVSDGTPSAVRKRQRR